MRKNRITITAATCATALGLAFGGAQLVSAEPSSPSGSESTKYTGEDIYRGVFFGQGPVAVELAKKSSFSDLAASLDKSNTPVVDAGATTVIDQISSAQPDFFNEFGKALNSGSPRQVQAALEDGSTALEEVDGASVDRTDRAQDCGVTVAVAGAVVHVGALVTAAAGAVTVTVAVGANVVYAQNWFWGGDSAGTDTLSQEQATAELTDALA